MSESRKWSYAAGERPNTVVVYERVLGGSLYVRAWDSTLSHGKGAWRRTTLGHRDKERAKAYALEQAAKLMKGEKDLHKGTITLGQIFSLYRKHRTPRKTRGERKEDDRRIELWTRVLGAEKDPHRVTMGEWEEFQDCRLSGALSPRGNVVPKPKREPVRPRSVEKDCLWLRWVFGWAEKWRTPQGFYLMRENPLRGFDIPREKNPRRPIATQDRFEAIRKVSDQHTMDVRWNGKRRKCRSHLTELLEVVNGTGRRISAVCHLRYEDLRLERTKACPDGAIRWPAATDKMGTETTVPVTPQVRKILDRILRERPGIGALPLFPKPADRQKALSRHLADKWLREGERLAGLDPLEGGLWHPYRRKWATERKHLPDVDVAAAGGWRNTVTLKTAYQQADSETILRVVLEAAELREAK